MSHVTRMVIDFETEDKLNEREAESLTKELAAYLGGVALPEAEFEYDKDSIKAHTHRHVLRDGSCSACYNILTLEPVLDPDYCV